MGWIGIAGGNAVNVKREKKKPFTPEQYNAVLAFFQENAGNFYTVNEVDEEAEIGSEGTTQAIIDVQIADPKTGVRQDPKSGRYGIPKKRKK
jgi:hypothetical protein|tara:strand:+ start:486 stop:761 length:276 start_codon:yes stop_codon:yes gene_type:complete